MSHSRRRLPATARQRRIHPAALLVLLMISQPAFSAQEEIRAACDAMEFAYSFGRGATLQVFGVPVINESSFWVVNPTWTEHYFGGDLQKDLISTATVDEYQGGTRITLRFSLQEKDCTTRGHQTFILLPGNTYRSTVEFTVTRQNTDSSPIIFEWNPAMLNGVLLAGMPYSCSGGPRPTEGFIPREVSFSGCGVC